MPEPTRQRGSENRMTISMSKEVRAALDSLATSKGLSRSAMIAKLITAAARQLAQGLPRRGTAA